MKLSYVPRTKTRASGNTVAHVWVVKYNSDGMRIGGSFVDFTENQQSTEWMWEPGMLVEDDDESEAEPAEGVE